MIYIGVVQVLSCHLNQVPHVFVSGSDCWHSSDFEHPYRLHGESELGHHGIFGKPILRNFQWIQPHLKIQSEQEVIAETVLACS